MTANAFVGPRRTLRAAGAVSLLLVLQGLAGAAERSVWDGVYTADQAERGAEVWGVECLKCHEVEEFTSPLFLLTWSGTSVDDLLEQVRTTMPQDNPGKLSRRELVELVAYMLRENGVPQGDAELSTEAQSLQLIRIERAPPR